MRGRRARAAAGGMRHGAVRYEAVAVLADLAADVTRHGRARLQVLVAQVPRHRTAI